MTRQEANFKIIKNLLKLSEDNPDLRFGQLLFVFGIVQEHPDKEGSWTDEFYTDSSDLLERLEREVK